MRRLRDEVDVLVGSGAPAAAAAARGESFSAGGSDSHAREMTARISKQTRTDAEYHFHGTPRGHCGLVSIHRCSCADLLKDQVVIVTVAGPNRPGDRKNDWVNSRARVAMAAGNRRISNEDRLSSVTPGWIRSRYKWTCGFRAGGTKWPREWSSISAGRCPGQQRGGNFICRAEDLSPNGWNAVVGIVLTAPLLRAPWAGT